MSDTDSKKTAPPEALKTASNGPRKGLDMAAVYRDLRGSLMRFAYRYYKKPQDIEDVVQEAFVKVCEAQQQREIQHPKSYMYQTVRNLALRQLDKSDYKLTDTVGDIVPDSVLLETPTMEEQFESRQKFELFCRAVRQLPNKCQQVYILRRVYGFSHKEIAERLNISLKTVEAHLSKAIVRCTDYMDAEEALEQQTEASASANGEASQPAPPGGSYNRSGHYE